MAQRDRQGPRPQDYTGVQGAKLQKEHAEEQARRAGEMALITAAENAAKENQVTDLTGPTPVVRESEDDEVTVLDEVSTRDAPTRVIRSLETFDPTIGAGQHYSFKEGEKYRVPSHVADHLLEKGLVTAL